MLDIGWTELMVIGALALIVVGPKELPGLLRTVGQYVGKARSVAREFQRSMEDAAREADITALKDLKDAKRDFDRMARVDFSEQAKRTQASMMSGGKKPAAASAAAPAPAAAPGPSEAPAPDASAAPDTGPSAAPAPAPSGTAESRGTGGERT